MRILIADDDATSRLMLTATAARLGHEYLVAPDGLSAWELLRSVKVDVLLTDWMMPGVDGPELCRRVRSELTGRYVYIVMITGLDAPEQILQGMSAGADDYLVKPVDPFAVQTRLVAAERVTSLHREVLDIRAQLEKVNEELVNRTLTDPLTGIGNRRSMEQDLSRAHSRAQRSAEPYSVILFDIDYFKLYNDQQGHLAGDEALRQVARCFNRVIRAEESVYRYGGEEFLLLLPNCGGRVATAAGDRIRLALMNAELPHPARPEPPFVITLSAGVASYLPGSGVSHSELVKRADEALFEAKRAGRNRVWTAD